jgi:hypothetical protein
MLSSDRWSRAETVDKNSGLTEVPAYGCGEERANNAVVGVEPNSTAEGSAQDVLDAGDSVVGGLVSDGQRPRASEDADVAADLGVLRWRGGMGWRCTAACDSRNYDQYGCQNRFHRDHLSRHPAQ